MGDAVPGLVVKMSCQRPSIKLEFVCRTEEKRLIYHVVKKDNKKLNKESKIEDEPDQTHPLYVLGLE